VVHFPKCLGDMNYTYPQSDNLHARMLSPSHPIPMRSLLVPGRPTVPPCNATPSGTLVITNLSNVNRDSVPECQWMMRRVAYAVKQGMTEADAGNVAIV